MKKIFLSTLLFFFVMAGKSQTAEDYVNSGLVKFNNKDYSGAIDDYSIAIAKDPGFIKAYLNRGRAKGQLGDFAGAIADYTQIIEIDPHNTGAYTSRGNARASIKDFKAAIADFDYILTIEETNSAAYVNRANVKRQMKDYKGAMIDVDFAIDIDPKYFGAYLSRAGIKRSMKDYDGAIADCNQVIAINPKYVSAYYARAYTKIKKKDYTGAFADINKCLELDPNSAAAYSYRGIAYYSMGKNTEAVESYTKSISLDPGYSSSYTNIAESLARLRRFPEAAGYYNTYLKLGLKSVVNQDPTWAFLKKYLESILYGIAKEDYNAALKSLQESEKLYNGLEDKDDDFKTSSLTSVYALMGYVLEKLNRNAEARDVYKQALVIDPSQQDITQSLSALESKLSAVAMQDKIPPTIDIISPKPTRSFDIESDNVKTEIIGRAKDPSGIAEIKINGALVEKTEEDGLFISELELKPGKNEITISAKDKQGNESSKTFTLTGNTVSTAKPAETVLSANSSAKYYAILIAENDYTDPNIPSLKNPIRDARELKTILQSMYTFNESDIDTVFNGSREDILQAIMLRCNQLTPNDNLLIFYAGHGTAIKDKHDDVDGYWVPISAKKDFPPSYISANDINTALKRSNAKHILLIADACFSGALTRSFEDASTGIQRQYNVPSRKIMASGNLERVPDNSKFLFYMRKSLADNKKKYLSAKDLYDGFYNAVLNNTDNVPQYAAIRGVGDEGGEFIFIKK